MASTSSNHPLLPSREPHTNMDIHPHHQQGRAHSQSNESQPSATQQAHHHLPQQQHHPSASGLHSPTPPFHHTTPQSAAQPAHQSLGVPSAAPAPSFPTLSQQNEHTSLFSFNTTQGIPPLPPNLFSNSNPNNVSSPVLPHALAAANPNSSSPMFQRSNMLGNNNDFFPNKNNVRAIPSVARNSNQPHHSVSPLFSMPNVSANSQTEIPLNAVTGDITTANVLDRPQADPERVNRHKRSREEMCALGASVLDSTRAQYYRPGASAESVPSIPLAHGMGPFPSGMSMGRRENTSLPMANTFMPFPGAAVSLAAPGSAYGKPATGDEKSIGVRYKTPVEHSESLRLVIERNQNKLANCHTLKGFLNDTEMRIQQTPGLAGEMWQGPRGSKRNMSFRYPRGEDDVEVLLDEASVLEDSWYARLREALSEQLDEIRQSAFQTEMIMERKLDMQRQFRTIPMEEVDRRMEYCRAKFLKCRLAVLEKFKTYVRALKWVHLSPLRQRRGSYSRVQNNVLRLWLFQHFADPYPSQAEKQELMTKCQMNDTQISNWMINSRVRIWKPCLNAVSQSQAAQETVRQLEEKREQMRQDAAHAKRMRAGGSMDVGGTSSGDGSGNDGGAPAALGTGMDGGRRGW